MTLNFHVQKNYVEVTSFIIICTMCVHTYIGACMRVTQFSLKLLQLHIFGKLLVLINFLSPLVVLEGLLYIHCMVKLQLGCFEYCPKDTKVTLHMCIKIKILT